MTHDGPRVADKRRGAGLDHTMFVFLVALCVAGLMWQFWPVTLALAALWLAAKLIARHDRRKG